MQLQGLPNLEKVRMERINKLRQARLEALRKGDTQRASDIADAFAAEFPDESVDYGPKPTAPPQPQVLTEEKEPEARTIKMPANFSMGEKVQVVGLKFFPGGAPGQRITEGAQVWLVGLDDNNASESVFNGAMGSVAGWDTNTSRWKVLLNDGSRKLLDPVHLALAPADATSLNGKTGAIVGWDENQTRWQVVMDDGSGKTFAPGHLVKASNVTVAEAPSAPAAHDKMAQTKMAMEVAQEALRVATEALQAKQADNQTTLENTGTPLQPGGGDPATIQAAAASSESGTPSLASLVPMSD